MVPGTDDDEGDNKDNDYYQPESLKPMAACLKCITRFIASHPGHAIIVADDNVAKLVLEVRSDQLPRKWFAGNDDVYTAIG
jgi:hypothetical protein